MNFIEAEQTYRRLVQQKQAGQITEGDFAAAVQTLRVQTPDGVWWQMRAEDGAWMRWDGSSWVVGQPQPVGYAQPQPVGYVPPRPKKKRSPILACFMILGIIACGTVCLLVAAGAGGYYMISTGQWSQREILNTVGLGAGEINIVNIADDTLKTELIRMDTESGEPETVNSEDIAPFEISGYGGIQPGLYELHITTPSGLPAGGICRMSISSGDALQFVAVPSGIAVSKDGTDAQSADDLDMATSGLCR